MQIPAVAPRERAARQESRSMRCRSAICKSNEYASVTDHFNNVFEFVGLFDDRPEMPESIQKVGQRKMV